MCQNTLGKTFVQKNKEISKLAILEVYISK